MGEFFRSGRRKAGCVTLVFACVFMVGWVRGYAITDHLCFEDSDDDCHWLTTSCDGVTWFRSELSHAAGWFQSKSTTNTVDCMLDDKTQTLEVVWRWRFCGFDFGELHSRGFGRNFAHFTFPYWSIVLPLTLLSAYLLLSKPRSSRQNKSLEPAANQGS